MTNRATHAQCIALYRRASVGAQSDHCGAQVLQGASQHRHRRMHVQCHAPACAEDEWLGELMQDLQIA
jgi:hypothetical protein